MSNLTTFRKQIKKKLFKINWENLKHSYGSPSEVPNLILDVLSVEPNISYDAYPELTQSLCHQGTIYSATPLVVPFLLEIYKFFLDNDIDSDINSYDILDLLLTIAQNSSRYPDRKKKLDKLRKQDLENYYEIYSHFQIEKKTAYQISKGINLYLELLEHSTSDDLEGIISLINCCVEYSGRIIPILRTTIDRNFDDSLQALMILSLIKMNLPDKIETLKELRNKNEGELTRFVINYEIFKILKESTPKEYLKDLYDQLEQHESLENIADSIYSLSFLFPDYYKELYNPVLKNILKEYGPFPLENEFVINDKFSVMLKDKRSHVYIAGKKIKQCMNLAIKISDNKLDSFINDNSIDDIEIDNLDIFNELSPEEKFWGYCSNLQVWAENDYDTRLLYRRIAFPLLKKLTDAGDSIAKKVFKNEINKRLSSGNRNVILYLINQGYLNYLNYNEFKTLNDRLHLDEMKLDYLDIIALLLKKFSEGEDFQARANLLENILEAIKNTNKNTLYFLLANNYFRLFKKKDLKPLQSNLDEDYKTDLGQNIRIFHILWRESNFFGNLGKWMILYNETINLSKDRRFLYVILIDKKVYDPKFKMNVDGIIDLGYIFIGDLKSMNKYFITLKITTPEDWNLDNLREALVKLGIEVEFKDSDQIEITFPYSYDFILPRIIDLNEALDSSVFWVQVVRSLED